MPLSIGVNDENAWTKIYEERKEVERTGIVSYIPIAPITIPFLLESPIVAIGTSSESAKRTWWLGGTLVQKVETTVVGSSIELSSERMPLNRVRMFVLPKYTETYQLEFRVPPWFEDLTLAVWEFQGSYSDDQTEQIEVARVQLAALDAKLDALPEKLKDALLPLDAGEIP